MKLFFANGYATFLTGEHCPSRFIIIEGGMTSNNPLHTQWLLIVQNLDSALYASISPFILHYVLNLDSCADIWETIDKQLQSLIRACIIQLKNKLHNLSFHNKTMSQYLLEIKVSFDLMDASGSLISTEDVITTL